MNPSVRNHEERNRGTCDRQAGADHHDDSEPKNETLLSKSADSGLPFRVEIAWRLQTCEPVFLCVDLLQVGWG